MNRKVLMAVALGVVVVAAAGLWCLSRPRLTDEQQITRNILEIKQAAEARSAGGILRHVSDDYSDGLYTKRDITRLVVSAMRHPEAIEVHVEQPRIEVSGDTARVEVRAMYWVGFRSTAAPPNSLELTLDFARTRRGWQIIRAGGWQSAGAEW